MKDQQNPKPGQQSCPPGSASSQNVESTSTSSSTQNVESKVKHHQQEARHQTEQMKEDVKETSLELRQQAESMKEAVKEKLSETKHDAQKALHEQGSRVKREGQEFLSQQKDRAAEEASHLADALRQTGERLHDEGDNNLAVYAERAAEKIDQVSGYLRDRQPGHLLDDVERVARSRPELVFGGLFIVGLGIARFLKASSSQHRGSRRVSWESTQGQMQRIGELQSTGQSKNPSQAPPTDALPQPTTHSMHNRNY